MSVLCRYVSSALSYDEIRSHTVVIVKYELHMHVHVCLTGSQSTLIIVCLQQLFHMMLSGRCLCDKKL